VNIRISNSTYYLVMAGRREENNDLADVKVEVVKDDVTDVCVLCEKEGHMGKDCKEIVCILCGSRGHLMEECGDIIEEDIDQDAKVRSLGDTPMSDSKREKPAIRLKNLTDLLEKEGRSKLISLEEIVNTPQAVPTTVKEQPQVVSKDDVKFHRSMIKMFEKTTPPDVIALFKQKYCGLCCIKFSCEKFAKKHYEGKGHESLIRKKTFRNRPMGWQMVFHALISVDPEGASEDEIFDYIIETFSAHISDDLKQVRAEMVATIKDMVERFHNVIESAGIYRLRDRKPGDAPKPVPEGLVEKKKSGEDADDTKPGSYIQSSYQRRPGSRNYDRDIVKRSSDFDRDRRYRRERSSRGESDRGRSHRDRSRSRGRDHRRSGHRHRSRSSHRRRSSAERRSDKSLNYNAEPEIIPNFVISKPNQNCYAPANQQVLTYYQPYSLPTFVTTASQGTAEFSSLVTGFLSASQTQQVLTPPPTPEEF